VSRPTIAVVGSVNLDLVVRCARLPRPGETLSGATFARYPGGKGANQAVAAAQLGARVLRMANSVTFNPFAHPVSNTPEAVRRIGLSNLRTLALTLAVEQLSSGLATSALGALAEETWHHSLDVAAWAFAISDSSRRSET